MRKHRQENENAIPFKLCSHKDLVAINNVVKPLQDVMAEQWEMHPDAKVAYHQLNLDETAAKAFTLTPSHTIAYVPNQDANSKVTLQNIASKENVAKWNTHCMHIIWQVRWAPRGLSPVKPMVRLIAEVALQPGEACHCSEV